MSKSVYISTVESNSGKSLISLGLLELLLRKTSNIGYYRPIVKSKDKDQHTQLILDYFELNQKYEECYSFTSEKVIQFMGSGKIEKVIDKVIDDFKKLENQYDFVLVEGTDYTGKNTAFEFEINAMIARNIGSPVLLVGTGKDKQSTDAANELKFALDSFLDEECEVIGAILNRVDPTQEEVFKKALKQKLGGTGRKKELTVIPDNIVLSSPSVSEIVEQLNAEVLFGKDFLDKNLVYRFSVAGMSVGNYLEKITENCAVIASGDRGEIVLGSLQANRSENYPNISCIILTGGFDMAPSIYRLLQGLPDNVPILKVQPNTFHTAVNLSNVKSNLRKENPIKIELALQYFHEKIDATNLEDRIAGFKPKGMTPKMFKYNLMSWAKRKRKQIVLPEGNDLRILQATEQLMDMDVVDITLLYNEPEVVIKKIKDNALNIDTNKVKIIAPAEAKNFKAYSNTLLEARKHKGMTKQAAKDFMNDVSYFGTMMVHQGHADGMVSGAINTTQHTIRPALQFVKTKPGINVVSSVFFMCLEDRVLVYGDCAVNPNPTAEQLAEIAISSAETAEAFGVEPKVAMLSYSSGASGKGEEVEKVRKATEIVKSLKPNLLIEGPIQYDAAVDATVGKQKMPDSKVAGEATVLIFPDLNTGNNTYKAVQRETGAIAIGPVLQGLNKPVNDLSRGCTVEDIINTVIITAIQAQNN